MLIEAAKTGRPLIGTDPASIYMFRSEYLKAGIENLPKVWSVEEFLIQQVAQGHQLPTCESGQMEQILFLHCTEQAMRPRVRPDWTTLMNLIGIPVRAAETGCCGMSGMFGHERRHIDWSRKLFDLSWKAPIQTQPVVYATGFSCRCQVERFSTKSALHPMELIAGILEDSRMQVRHSS